MEKIIKYSFNIWESENKNIDNAALTMCYEFYFNIS